MTTCMGNQVLLCPLAHRVDEKPFPTEKGFIVGTETYYIDLDVELPANGCKYGAYIAPCSNRMWKGVSRDAKTRSLYSTE